MSILLNDILNIKDLDNVKIRFVLTNNIVDPLELFKNDKDSLLDWQFWNTPKENHLRKEKLLLDL